MPKTYSAVQKMIDALEEKLLQKGLSWKEIDKHSELNKLYALRDKAGSKELQTAYDDIWQRVAGEFPTKHSDWIEGALDSVYSLRKPSKHGTEIYFASEYTPKAVANERDTAEQLTRYYLGKIANERHGVESADVLFGNASPLTQEGKAKLMEEASMLAKKTQDAVKGHFFQSNKVPSYIPATALLGLQTPELDPTDFITNLVAPGMGSVASRVGQTAVSPLLQWMMQQIGPPQYPTDIDPMLKGLKE